MTEAIYLFLLAIVVAAAIAVYWFRRGQEETFSPDPGTYIEGLKALLRDQDEQAFAMLKETVLNDTGNIHAYIHLGNIFRRRKKYDQAMKVHRDLTHRGNLTESEKQEILMALYKDYHALGDEQTAIKAIKELLKLMPKNRNALQILLRWLEKNCEWKEAALTRKQIDKLEKVDSGSLLALYKVFGGDELSEKGDTHRARLFYKEALHIDKNCLAAYVAIGESYYGEQRLDDALEYWTKVVALNPRKSQVVFERLKRAYFEVGHYGEYADTLAKLLQAFPEHLTARLELAYFLEKKGETNTAREHFVAGQDHHPDSLIAKLGLYRLNRETDRKEAAENIFKQIMQIAVKREAKSFVCKECDLVVDNKIWLCPRCKAVDSFN
ncbi:MAG: hypothetical protein V3V99_09830 [candidate division Zixibacteria bacterium]